MKSRAIKDITVNSNELDNNYMSTQTHEILVNNRKYIPKYKRCGLLCRIFGAPTNRSRSNSKNNNSNLDVNPDFKYAFEDNSHPVYMEIKGII